ncbi:zinc protease [Devosia sp. YR412]|uniref:M16 family metallopeptidase n=1 Tax=Devosia sp. YR412 TaxID=1881030 RepID=UPI0008CFFFD1|nr:pitrilysin family protein [Devosia sp. YR412]SEQ02056.1 zinc protease [Devosia sp. YR412]
MTFFATLRRRIALVAAPALLLLAVLPAQAEVQFQQITSPKGIKAWLVEDYAVPIITIRFAFDGGSTQDQPGKEGTANLITALFDEGAGDLDSDAFQIALDAAGAEMGFTADLDTVYGSMRLLAEQKDEALGLLKLAIEEPRFDQNPIDRMRAQILSGIAADAQNPATAAQKLWNETLYGTHSYARPVDGTPETINTITADDLRAFHKATFARDNLHIAIVGAVDAETAASMIDDLFGALPEHAELTPVADIAPALGKDLAVDYPLPQTSIFMAFPAVRVGDPDYYAATLMNEILGGGSVLSRLNAEVREKRGLSYGVSSGLFNQQHANGLVLNTSTRADRAGETLGVIEDVLAKMAAEGPTDEELASAKKYLIGSAPLRELGSSQAIASTLIGLQLWDLGIDYLPQRADLLNAVTVDDVKAVAAKLLGTKPTVLLLGPKVAQ